MQWSLEWSEHEESLRQIHIQSDILPPALAAKPELNEAELWLYRCYLDLARDRRYAESGPLPITLQEIVFYCQFYQILEARFLVTVVTELDNIYLAKAAEKLKQTLDKAGRK